ncbi:YvrJ family protein [Priestia megaterium]|uniref:YvrJ family protein n=1 Tax=Priestia megaterium TaxID=1404 RepID=UPI0012B98A27|nr:YvrJ family protein [Priestia megaterium]
MDPTTIPTWIYAVSNFGFPVVMTFYLLLRFEKKLERVNKVIIELANVIKNK